MYFWWDNDKRSVSLSVLFLQDFLTEAPGASKGFFKYSKQYVSEILPDYTVTYSGFKPSGT